jgi:hypothetical protein
MLSLIYVFFLKKCIFLLQRRQTINTKAVFKFRFHIYPFFQRQLDSAALALHDGSCLAFKNDITPWAMFFFVFRHITEV